MNSQRGISRRAGSSRALTITRAIYDEVNLALWAMAAVFALYVAAFVVPQIPQIHATAQLHRIAEMNAEYELYCGRLQMGPGMPLHAQCVRSLQEFRSGIETRMADDAGF